MENTLVKQKQKWWVYLLIALLFIFCSPFIILGFMIYLPYYLIFSPFEKKRFRKSGYEKYHRYFFGITAKTHYEVYRILTEYNIPFELDVHKEYDIVTYILKNGDQYNFVLCDDEFGTGQSDIDDDETGFAFLERLGELKYPQSTKGYFICLRKKDIERFEISEQEKEKLLNDQRIIDIRNILELVAKE